MTLPDAISFLEDLTGTHPDKRPCVSFPVSEGIETFLKEVKAMGYAAYVRTTEFGDEVVVTDRVRYGDA
jgi:hypothetical protein